MGWRRNNDIWDLQDPRRPRHVAWSFGRIKDMSSGLGGVPAAAYRADGRMAVTVDRFREVDLWDLSEIEQPRLRAVLAPRSDTRPADTDPAVVFGSRGELVAVTSSPNAVQLWDVTAPRPRRLAVLPGDSPAFAPDGRTLAVADQRGVVQLWDVSSRAPRRLADLTNEVDVTSLAFSPTGLLAVGEENGAVGLWDVTDRGRPLPLDDSPRAARLGLEHDVRPSR